MPEPVLCTTSTPLVGRTRCDARCRVPVERQRQCRKVGYVKPLAGREAKLSSRVRPQTPVRDVCYRATAFNKGRCERGGQHSRTIVVRCREGNNTRPARKGGDYTGARLKTRRGLSDLDTDKRDFPRSRRGPAHVRLVIACFGLRRTRIARKVACREAATYSRCSSICCWPVGKSTVEV